MRGGHFFAHHEFSGNAGNTVGVRPISAIRDRPLSSRHTSTPVCRVAHALRENESDQAALHVLVFWHTERVPHTHQRLLCNLGRVYDEAPPVPLKNVVRYGGLDKAAATLKIGLRYAVRPRGYSRQRTYFRGERAIGVRNSTTFSGWR
ncbi:hypothetical protein BO443_20336 [Burkholderia orbicola]